LVQSPLRARLPGDGAGDVDAEQSGEQRRGEFGGQAEQGGGAVLAGAESELAQPFAELVGADWSPGLPPGGRPSGGSLVAEGGVAAAAGDEVADECGQGFGQDDGLVAEPQPHLLFVGANVVEW
jgi:hypothetical protein